MATLLVTKFHEKNILEQAHGQQMDIIMVL